MTPSNNSNSYKSVLVIVTGFYGIGWLFKSVYFEYLSIGIALMSLLLPFTVPYLLNLWNKIGNIIGWINTRIILGIIFYLILFPISLLYKFKKRNMLKGSKDSASMFKERNHEYTREDLTFPW